MNTGSLSISVVTPSYQQGRFLERTIRSVLDQGLAVDYFVADGGSSDHSLDVLGAYRDRLRFVSEPDGGQAAGVNRGIAATDGEIIGWLNSDDVYYPGALRAVREQFVARPEIDVIYGDAHHIDVEDRVLERYPTEPWSVANLRERCFLCQPATFFRRRVVTAHGMLDANLRYCMDYEYWLRLAARGVRFLHLPRVLAGSRMYPDNKTLGQRVAVHDEINTMLRRCLGRVPDRWLANYAHARLEDDGVDRARHPRRFARRVALRTWGAGLRWNRRVSLASIQTGSGWLLGSVMPRTRPAGDG